MIGNLTIPTQAGTLLPGPNDPPGEIKFLIPAGVSDHTETIAAVVSAAGESLIWAMGTHMHYVGRDMAVHLRRTNPQQGEPKQECLIQTPAWDFNWQRGYRYDAQESTSFDSSLRSPAPWWGKCSASRSARVPMPRSTPSV